LLDEPTAVLGVAETAKVEEIVQSLKSRNIGVLIISHRLEAVRPPEAGRQIADVLP
jgi:ABC-type sugar transport system ATPase subunit